MYRKILIIFISVFLGAYGVITQALVVFVLLILFLMINIKIKPFSLVVLNEMESISLITSMITIYCGLFYISDMPTSYTTDDDNGRKLVFPVIFYCSSSKRDIEDVLLPDYPHFQPDFLPLLALQNARRRTKHSPH